MNLINTLISEGWLKTPEIIKAFQEIKREDFLPEDIKNLAELNEALPIGYGQTISQPLVVAFMLEKLEPKIGEKILDVGAGSGWTTALLAYIVSQKRNSKQIPNSKSQIPKGKVVAMEIIPELVEFGKRNVAKYNFVERGIVKFICGDGSKGYKEEAPYDKILCSAEAKEIPEEWKKQLKIGGKIVTPMGNSIWEIEKRGEGDFSFKEYPGFVFVPLISK
jgi:protein-L-isoaspartate(D-aspartate) O-methyltransferase